MKKELPIIPPSEIKESWPGQFEIGRWLDNLIPFPMQVFIITTMKSNGLNNAQLNSWGMTIGPGSHPCFLFSVLINSDTYRYIRKNKEFVVNLPSIRIKEKALKTAKHYKNDEDELLASGLTPIKSMKVNASRIEECIAHYECVYEWDKLLPGGNMLICGEIVAASADESILTADIKNNIEKADVFFYLKETIDLANNKLVGKTYYGALSSNVREENEN